MADAEGLLRPDWPVPGNVRALVTTRVFGDARAPEARARLRTLLPAEPAWLRQVHGTTVLRAEAATEGAEADAAVTARAGAVCVAMAADCLPVLLADERGECVGAAHAGWRGLAAGVIEAALEAMAVPGARVVAWLGPAIGPRAYEVGEEVRAAFLAADPGSGTCFGATRPGHWHLDLYSAARRRLAARGVTRISGGGFCTASDAARFFSWRARQDTGRMAAMVWLA